MKKKIILLVGLFGIIFSSTAQGNQKSDADNEPKHEFSLNGQLRTRFEFRDGAFRPLAKGEEPAYPILNRVRLGLNYGYTDIVKTKITLQNVNLWGQANQVQTLDKSGNTFSLFEAWADVKLYKTFRAKIGRQVISYDDERLFGAADWTISGRSHDALTLYVTGKKFEVDFNFALNQNYKTYYGNNPNNSAGNLYQNVDAQGYKTMQNLWAKFNPNEHSSVSFLFNNTGFQNADSITASNKIHFLQTTGLNYVFNYEHLFGKVTGYYQFGQSLAANRSNAFMFAAQIGTKFKKKFSLSLGTDYLSGNNTGVFSPENRNFQTLFATGHKFYGNMDYYNAGNPYPAIGLVDNYLTFGYKINSKLNLNLAGHWFLTPNKINYIKLSVIDPTLARISNNLGQEIDFSFGYQILPFLNVSLGYSTYFTTELTGVLKGVKNMKGSQHWAWVSLNVTPEFFKKKF